jgi:hypothetical protein
MAAKCDFSFRAVVTNGALLAFSWSDKCGFRKAYFLGDFFASLLVPVTYLRSILPLGFRL